MNDQSQNKPSSLVFIGWFLIMTSAFLILSSTFGVVFKYFGGLDAASLKAAQLYPEPLNSLMVVFWFVYDIFLLVSSIQFLRLRAWARSSLEVLTWIYIMNALVFMILALLPIENNFINFLDSSLTQFGDTVLFILKVLIYSTFAICLTVAAIIVFKLRSATIRNAFVVKSRSDSFQQVI